MRLTLVLSIFLALAVGIACNQAAAPNIKKASSPTPIAAAPPSDGHDHASEANVPRITVADAKKDFEAGKAIFIDTRDTSSFKFARIKGAINISPSTVETSLDKIPKDKKIIAYCS